MAPFDWNRVDHMKPPGMSWTAWKRSHARYKAALDTLGYELRMTEGEFAGLTGPIARNKVTVARNGSQQEHTVRLGHLLYGNTNLLTKQERADSYARAGAKKRANQPKGQTVTNDTERDAIEALHNILGLTVILVCKHLWEFRRADVAYKHHGSPEDAYVPDQVKSSRVDMRHGMLSFKISVHQMVAILERGMSLTFIGMDEASIPKKVWFLTPIATTIDQLKALPDTRFTPMLQPKVLSSRPVTTAMSAFAYDLSNPEAVARLREAKIAFVIDAPIKRGLAFWNEDHSQIPCVNHQREMQSYANTRAAVQQVGAMWDKRTENNCGSPDFWVNRTRVEDKVACRSGLNGLVFCMRAPNRLPYSPNSFDMLQVPCVDDQIVYAIPMRTRHQDGTVTSTLSTEKLGKKNGYINIKEHAHNRYDLKDKDSILAYVGACEATALVPHIM